MKQGKENFTILCMIALFTIWFAYTGLVMMDSFGIDMWMILAGTIVYATVIFYFLKTIHHEKQSIRNK